MSIFTRLTSNPTIKKWALILLIPKNQHRPRLWVRIFLNPFFHKRGLGSVIRRRTRMDVFPYNKFILGKNSIVEEYSTVNNGVGDVIIGDGTIIGLSNVIIGPVHIGNNVMLAQNIVVSGLNHSFEDVSISPSHQKVTCREIVISDDVWIGANCVLTAGITIGKHTVVGAGSVVTKNLPDYCVAVGNPARVIKRYNVVTRVWERL
jgi:acetyltransferase-like isoleucine patch superfamily enzyme